MIFFGTYICSNNFNPNGIWIGLYSDLDNNASQFIWINGVRVMSLDLAVNEPDNEQIRNQSTCVRMKPSSQYALDDVKCTDTSPYLCTGEFNFCESILCLFFLTKVSSMHLKEINISRNRLVVK